MKKDSRHKSDGRLTTGLAIHDWLESRPPNVILVKYILYISMTQSNCSALSDIYPEISILLMFIQKR